MEKKKKPYYSVLLRSKYLYTSIELFHVYTLLQLHILNSFIIIILSLYSIMYDTEGVPW